MTAHARFLVVGPDNVPTNHASRDAATTAALDSARRSDAVVAIYQLVTEAKPVRTIELVEPEAGE